VRKTQMVTDRELEIMKILWVRGRASVREVQEAGMLSQTPVRFVPDSASLAQWLGVFPYVEPLALQAALLVLAVFAIAHTLRGRGASGHGAAPLEVKQRAVAGR